MKLIVTNFAYGTGPYLRTTEVALSTILRLKKEGRGDWGILVPWVYGERQKKILLEEFAGAARIIFLDKKLGGIMNSVFYGNNTYEEALRLWVENFEKQSEYAMKHLLGKIEVETLNGKKIIINASDITFEINRSPRLDFGISKRYGVTFGHTSEILEQTLNISTNIINVNRDLVRRAIPLSSMLERKTGIVCLSEPGTFPRLFGGLPKYKSEVMIPPTTNVPTKSRKNLKRGIYVTVTGIPGLERLYREARTFGLVIYTNSPAEIPDSVVLPISDIYNPNIIMQFARSGWGSVWMSQIIGVPLLVPDFDPKDDPEIYFNNRTIEKLGLGIIFRGQSLDVIIKESEKLKPEVRQVNNKLLEYFGTLRGDNFSAKIIAEDFIKTNL